MVSPVQFTNNRQVYFRGENEDLISAPGAYQQSAAASEMPADEVTLSTKEAQPKKKGGIGKTIAAVATSIVVAGAALFGLFKWKGAKWLNPNAGTTMDKFKNILMKPGEWLENTAKSIGKKLGIGGGKAGEDVAAAGARAGDDAAAGAAATGAKAGEDAAAGAAKAAEDAGIVV